MSATTTTDQRTPETTGDRLKDLALALLYDDSRHLHSLDILDRGYLTDPPKDYLDPFASRDSKRVKKSRFPRGQTMPRPKSMSTPRAHRYLKRHESAAVGRSLDFCIIYSSSVTGNAQFLEYRLREEQLNGIRLRADVVLEDGLAQLQVRRASTIICLQPSTEERSCVRALRALNMLPSNGRLCVLDNGSNGYNLEHDGVTMKGELLGLVPRIVSIIQQQIDEYSQSQISEDTCVEVVSNSKLEEPENVSTNHPSPIVEESSITASKIVDRTKPPPKHGNCHYIIYCTSESWEKMMLLDRELQLCGFRGVLRVIPPRKPLSQFFAWTESCKPKRETAITKMLADGFLQADVHVIAVTKDLSKFKVKDVDDPGRVFILGQTWSELAVYRTRHLRADCVPASNLLRLQTSRRWALEKYNYNQEILQPVRDAMLKRYGEFVIDNRLEGILEKTESL